MRSRSGRRNRIEHVRRGDEQHLGQIERHVEVVIAERVVLLRIEHFEQRRRRVAAEVGAELVDLVQDEDRIARLGAPQPLHDLARERADVGAAVAADFGLVAHAAERHADELAADRRGDRSRERRLADARRADEAEDRALHVRVQFSDRQIVEDAVLGLLEPRVIGVEHVFRRARDRSSPRFGGSRAGTRASRDRCATPCIRRPRPASSQAIELAVAPPSGRFRACRPPGSWSAAPRFPSSGRRLHPARAGWP